ncbi:RNase HII [Austwickia chelonae]|uniref:Ribonuclease HII n=1 Tax=Austwickia chelonae NBRC 105200 TaxID=1184607 RepID=K6UKN9_9MICO|nr:ribonuclease HII [Austwickia chelonae]GAB76561.1 ribonuclease HII [Austwickia chelonae NBRC 105200]SEW26877.1 RNase HII [Austwickia chelonae]
MSDPVDAGEPGEALPVRPRTRRRHSASRAAPNLRLERALQRQGYRMIAGMDEVGRGALAGPVSVGVVCLGPSEGSAPSGVRDSKLLTAAARESLVDPIRRWAAGWGVGHAFPEEIDALGITGALRLAGRRAVENCGIRPDLIILDGKYDWFTDPATVGLLGMTDEAGPQPPVQTRVKADMTCSSVAAASVLAKVERDAMMVVEAERYPGYGWEGNKGYGSAAHLEALRGKGPSEWHRRSWNLDGAMESQVVSREFVSPTTRHGVAGEAMTDLPSGMGHDGNVEVAVDGR